VVELEGRHFGPLGTAVEFPVYGKEKPGEFTAVECEVAEAHELIRCKTAPGAGDDLKWSVTVDGQKSVSPTTD